MKKKLFHVFTATTVAASIVSPTASAAVQEDSVGKEVTFTITQIAKNTLQTSKGAFTPDATMKALFSTTNKDALKGAEVTVIIKDGKIVEITELKLNASGSKTDTLVLDGGGIVINGDLVINADYISIQNMTVNNRTVIASNAKNEVTLDAVVIKKDLIVENNEVYSLFDAPAKGEHSRWLSLNLENTNVKVVDIKRKNVTLDSDERISRVILADNISAVELNADINTVIVNVSDELSITGYGHINTLQVDKSPSLFLNLQSTLGQVTVNDKSGKVDIGDLVSIHRLTLQPGQRVDAVIANYGTHKGKIQQLDGEKPASTAAPFINFSPDKNPTDIAWIWPITQTISVGDSFTLPTTVKAILYNQTEKAVPITWQTSQISTTVIGTQTLEGTVDGYSSKIRLTLTVVEGSKKTLQALLSTITYVPVSVDGKDIAKDKTWTTQAAYNALTSAVSAARTVSTSISASVTDIEIAELKLNSAIEKYNAAKRQGLMVVSNKEALSTAIKDITYVAVSTDGKEILVANKWTTQSAKDAIDTAVTAAQTTANRFDATQADIDAALATLNTAIATYKAAQRPGLKVIVDKAALEAAIGKVAYVKVSTDGKDIDPTEKWTTQAAYDALKTAADKAQAVLVKADATQAEITAAASTLLSAIETYTRAQKDGSKTADKTALKAEIDKIKYVKVSENGSELDASVKWTTAEVEKALKDAESAAKAVYTNSKATAAEVAAAVSALNLAITTYTAAQKDGTKPIPVNKTALTDAIAGVEYVDVSTDGKNILTTKKWTFPADKTTLQAAVGVAQAVVDKADATQTEVDGAVTVLQAAINKYKDAQRDGLKVDLKTLENKIVEAEEAATDKSVTIADNDEDLAPKTKWTTQEANNNLKSAITAAKAIQTKENVTQSEINDATSTLATALEVYKKSIETVTVDKTDLETAIAGVTYVAVSENGSDVSSTLKWTTKEVKEALENARSKAEAVKDDSNATQKNVDDALITLTNAIKTYTDEQEEGKQTSPQNSTLTAKTALTLTSSEAVAINVGINIVGKATFAQKSAGDEVIITFDNTISTEGKEEKFDETSLESAFTFTIGSIQYIAKKSGSTWTIDLGALDAPTKLTATAGKNSITLNWNQVDGATSYNIYRIDKDKKYTQIETNVTATTFLDNTAGYFQTHRYVVRAVNTAIESVDSAIIKATSNLVQNATQYDSKYVVISNESTDTTKTQSTGTIVAKPQTFSLPASLPPEAHQENPVLPDLHLPTVQSTSEPVTYKVGDTKSFWAHNFKDNSDYQTSATLKYVGTHSQVWVEGSTLTDAQAAQIGQEFDDNIFEFVTENFAPVSDVNKDGKVAILCLDIQDNYDSTSSYTAGYFGGNDLTGYSKANNMEIFYADINPAMKDFEKNTDVTKIFGTLTHEFQHMVNFNQQQFIEKSSSMDSWLNEGLSMAAEHIYLSDKGKLASRISYYNSSDTIRDGHSLLKWGDNSDTLSNYSLSYIFAQYVRIQAGQGDTIFKEILQHTGTPTEAVESVIKKYIDDEMTFGEFMTAFKIATVVQAPNGLYGFGGEEFFKQIKTPIYTGEGTSLSGGSSIVLEPATSLQSGGKGNDITYTGLIIEP